MPASREAGPALEADKYFTDPEQVDPLFPPAFTSFSVKSGDGYAACKLWLAAGPEPKGTVVINPPLEGHEGMNSVVIPVMNAGFNVLVNRPRGVRDGGTAYTLTKAVEDLHAVVGWIVAHTGKTTPSGATLRLDPAKIALFGISGGGGNNSYTVVAESKHAHYAIAVDPANPAAQLTPAFMEKMRPEYDAILKSSRGTVDWTGWMTLTPEVMDRNSIIKNAPKLVDKHLLYIGGAYTTDSPIDIAFRPNTQALRDAGAKDLTALIIESGDGLWTRRYTMTRMIIGWLQSQGF